MTVLVIVLLLVCLGLPLFYAWHIWRLRTVAPRLAPMPAFSWRSSSLSAGGILPATLCSSSCRLFLRSQS